MAGAGGTGPGPARTVRGRGQPGQVLPLVALIVVVAAGAALVVARLGGEVVDRARARDAADAAALAGVSGGRAAAAHVARADGATLERFVHEGDGVEVTVRVGGSRATARAAVGDDADPASGRASGREPEWPRRWRHATVHGP